MKKLLMLLGFLSLISCGEDGKKVTGPQTAAEDTQIYITEAAVFSDNLGTHVYCNIQCDYEDESLYATIVNGARSTSGIWGTIVSNDGTEETFYLLPIGTRHPYKPISDDIRFIFETISGGETVSVLLRDGQIETPAEDISELRLELRWECYEWNEKNDEYKHRYDASMTKVFSPPFKKTLDQVFPPDAPVLRVDGPISISKRSFGGANFRFILENLGANNFIGSAFFVKPYLTLRDENGTVIGSEWTYINGSTGSTKSGSTTDSVIKGGEKVEVEMWTSVDPDRISSYSLEIEWMEYNENDEHFTLGEGRL